MRLTIDLTDTSDTRRGPEDAIGIIRGALRDRGYAVAVTAEATPHEQPQPISPERRREILKDSTLGAQVLAGEKR